MHHVRQGHEHGMQQVHLSLGRDPENAVAQHCGSDRQQGLLRRRADAFGETENRPCQRNQQHRVQEAQDQRPELREHRGGDKQVQRMIQRPQGFTEIATLRGVGDEDAVVHPLNRSAGRQETPDDGGHHQQQGNSEQRSITYCCHHVLHSCPLLRQKALLNRLQGRPSAASGSALCRRRSAPCASGAQAVAVATAPPGRPRPMPRRPRSSATPVDTATGQTGSAAPPQKALRRLCPAWWSGRIRPDKCSGSVATASDGRAPSARLRPPQRPPRASRPTAKNPDSPTPSRPLTAPRHGNASRTDASDQPGRCSQVQPLEHRLRDRADDQHDQGPEPRRIKRRHFVGDAFDDALRDLRRLREQGGRQRQALGHRRVDEARLDRRDRDHRRAVVGEFLQRKVHVPLAGLLVGQRAVGDQGDVDLAQRGQAAAHHQRVRLDVVGIHLVQRDMAGAPRFKVGCGLFQFLDVARHQEKIAAFRGPQTRASAGDGGGGADDQDFLHCSFHKITRLQKRDIKEGSRSASSCSQAGYARRKSAPLMCASLAGYKRPPAARTMSSSRGNSTFSRCSLWAKSRASEQVAHGRFGIGGWHHALVLLKPPTAVDAVPVQNPVEGIKKRLVVAAARFTLAGVQAPVQIVERAEGDLVDQRHRRRERHAEFLALADLKRAVLRVVPDDEHPAAGFRSLCQAVHPGHAVFVLLVELGRQREEFRQIGETHSGGTDLAGADRHQLNLRPMDDAGEAKAANAGAEKGRLDVGRPRSAGPESACAAPDRWPPGSCRRSCGHCRKAERCGAPQPRGRCARGARPARRSHGHAAGYAGNGPRNTAACSCGDPEHEQKRGTDELAGAVTNGEHHRVFVHLAAVGQHPHPRHPEQQQRAGEPDDVGGRVQISGFRILDVQRQNHHREIARRRAKRGNHVQIAGVVAATAGQRVDLPRTRIPQLGVALDHRQTQKDEHRKGQDPERQKQQRGTEGQRQQGRHHHQSGFDRQAAAGERPVAFAFVMTVITQVEQVVEDVDAGSTQAEAQKGDDAVAHQFKLSEAVRRQQRHEHHAPSGAVQKTPSRRPHDSPVAAGTDSAGCGSVPRLAGRGALPSPAAFAAPV
nr:hypothetical protein [Tanacetum cinerariifolium]